jgi:NitT/TauT family transport system substrate-binding protein
VSRRWAVKDRALNRGGEHHLVSLILVFLLTILFPVNSTTAQNTLERPLEKLTIAFSSVSANMAPLWITQERGFFRKYGLDVQLVFIESGSTTVQSLISKEVAFAQMAGAGVLQSRLRGSDVVLIAGFLNTMDYQLMVDKNITRPDHLKGKTMAVSRFGSSSDFATRYALDKFGLVPDKDVTILEIGSQPARFAALESGKIQAAMVAIPLTRRAKTLGFHALADLQMLGLEYQHTGLATTDALIRARPDLVRNVMKAYVEGIHYYKTRRAGSLGILAKYLKTPNIEVLTEVHENLGLKLTPQKPYPTLRGIEIMLRELAAREPKARRARPDEFVNLAFIKELDHSGFIDRLYKAQPMVANREERPTPVAPIPPETAVQSNLKTRAAGEEAKSVSVSATKSGQYTVETGDTLSYLALKYYGDQYKWEKIYEANKQAMKSPHSLYVGQKIIIPLLDGKLFGDQSLPVFGQSPDYKLERSSAGATIISDVSEPR